MGQPDHEPDDRPHWLLDGLVGVALGAVFGVVVYMLAANAAFHISAPREHGWSQDWFSALPVLVSGSSAIAMVLVASCFGLGTISSRTGWMVGACVLICLCNILFRGVLEEFFLGIL